MAHGIDPKRHGSGVRGGESKRKIMPDWVDRSYHYLAGTTPEAAFQSSPHVYESEVPDEKIYDYQKDPLNLRVKSRWGDGLDVNLYEKNIRDSGYHGYINRGMPDKTMSSVVALFHPIKPTSVRARDNMQKTKSHSSDLRDIRNHPDLGMHKEYKGFKYQPSAGMYSFIRPGSNKVEYSTAKDFKEFHDTVIAPSTGLNKAKNSRDQRAQVWGVHAQPPRMSDKRIKMMRHIRDFVQHALGIDLSVAQGKIDTETGKLKTPVSQLPEHEKPYDIFTDKGVAEEHRRLAALAEANKGKAPAEKPTAKTPGLINKLRRMRAAAGLAPTRRMDPKPDWRSGKLQTQPSPDAAVHEIGHLLLTPEGTSLGQTQEDMDHEFGQVIAKIGFLKQKMTQGEIQPMAVENKIRRVLGLPANKQSMNPRPMSEHGRPVEQALDQPTPRFVRGVAEGQKGPQSVDLIRQTRLLSPANSERFDKFIRGEIQYHPEKGWVPGTSPDSKINQRARAAADEPNPDKYFARKDKDTLMRSEGSDMSKSDYSRSVAQKIKLLKEACADKREPSLSQQVKTVKEKYAPKMAKGGNAGTASLASTTGAAAGMRNAFGGGSPAPAAPAPAPAPSTNTGSFAGNITAGLNSMLGKSDEYPDPKEEFMKLREKLGRDPTEKEHSDHVGDLAGDYHDRQKRLKKATEKFCSLRKAKWPVPGLVPPSGDKGVGGQKALKKSEGADAETAKINENKKKPEASQRHKFKAAQWTHPNGHPRCIICGDEERTDGMCDGLKKSDGKWHNLGSPTQKPFQPSLSHANSVENSTRMPKPAKPQTRTSVRVSTGRGVSVSMSKASNQDLKPAADARKQQYAAKVLGSFADGQILHNDAGHPGHAQFSRLNHMRASLIHTKKAGEMEAAKQYPEAAHHREQAAKHKAAWKGGMAKSEGLEKRSKNVREQTRNITREQRAKRLMNYFKRQGLNVSEGRQDRFGIGKDQRGVTYSPMAGSPEHEVGHVIETPVGTTLRDHQKNLGQVSSNVGMPQSERVERESTAFKIQPMIERRAGVKPDNSGAHVYHAKKEPKRMDAARDRAHREMGAYDEGRKVIGPKGQVTQGTSIDAKINQRAQKSDGPKLQVVPHPPEVIDVDPEILSSMKARLGQEATENTAKLVAAVKKFTASKNTQGQPPFIDDGFKNKLAAITKPLDKAAPAKELWQMTRKEYDAKYGQSRANATSTRFHPHAGAVETAMNRGLPVPPAVVADYPHLLPKK